MYPGVGSAFSGNGIGRKYGGVICTYNDTHIALLGAVNSPNSTSARMIFTGIASVYVVMSEPV